MKLLRGKKNLLRISTFDWNTKQIEAHFLLVLCSYTHDIEALSCDELLVDASALLAELGIAAEDLAKAIRADIKEKTGCSASVGMGELMLCCLINHVFLCYKLKPAAFLFRLQHPVSSAGNPQSEARRTVLLKK